VQLESEAEVVQVKERYFDVWVGDRENELTRSRVAMPVAAATTMAVRMSMTFKLANNMEGTDLMNLLQSLTQVISDRTDGDFSPDQLALIDQVAISKTWRTLNLEITSRENSHMTVETIEHYAPYLVDAARSLGYNVADGAEQTISGRLIDAACSYTCGAGCNPCDNDAACVWDLDCRSGNCHDGVCYVAPAKPKDLAWLWVLLSLIGAAVLVFASVIVIRKVKLRIRENSREALLSDIDLLGDDD
jgi:hypothetical protein